MKYHALNQKKGVLRAFFSIIDRDDFLKRNPDYRRPTTQESKNMSKRRRRSLT
jgi:hypothetical protein